MPATHVPPPPAGAMGKPLTLADLYRTREDLNSRYFSLFARGLTAGATMDQDALDVIIDSIAALDDGIFGMPITSAADAAIVLQVVREDIEAGSREGEPERAALDRVIAFLKQP